MVAPSTSAEANISPRIEEIDASFRPVALFFTAKAAFWLLAASLVLLLASVKLHSPGMLADKAWLSYGRLVPAGWNMLVYGFAGQAASLVGLWILARVSRQQLMVPLLALGGGVCWNIGTLVGVVGILMGYSTGRELLEMPAAAMAFMVLAGGLIGTSGWLTFASRTEETTYPSAWFALLALLAFVWFGTVALMMYSGDGVRGIMQVLVQRWYATGILRLWLGGVALAALFLFIPALVNRPLASRSLALWAFWSLVVFTPWAATGHGDPFPRWIIGLGLAGLFLGGAGLVAIGLNWWKTVEGQLGVLFSTLPGKLLGAAAVAYVLGGALDYVVALPDVAPVLRFTWIHQGLDWLLVGGAVGLSLFALLPDLLARSSGIKLAPGLLSAHAWLSLIGVALIAVALLLAGVVQGLGLSAGKPFLEVMRSSMHPVRFSTMGLLIFALGQVTFFVAVLRLLGATAREYVTVARGWFAPVQTGKEVVRP